MAKTQVTLLLGDNVDKLNDEQKKLLNDDGEGKRVIGIKALNEIYIYKKSGEDGVKKEGFYDNGEKKFKDNEFNTLADNLLKEAFGVTVPDQEQKDALKKLLQVMLEGKHLSHKKLSPLLLQQQVNQALDDLKKKLPGECEVNFGNDDDILRFEPLKDCQIDDKTAEEALKNFTENGLPNGLTEVKKQSGSNLQTYTRTITYKDDDNKDQTQTAELIYDEKTRGVTYVRPIDCKDNEAVKKDIMAMIRLYLHTNYGIKPDDDLTKEKDDSIKLTVEAGKNMKPLLEATLNDAGIKGKFVIKYDERPVQQRQEQKTANDMKEMKEQMKKLNDQVTNLTKENQKLKETFNKFGPK